MMTSNTIARTLLSRMGSLSLKSTTIQPPTKSFPLLSHHHHHLPPSSLSPSPLENQQNQQQIRNKVTKTRKHRLRKKALKAKMLQQGIDIPKPPKYIDKHTPIINGISREEQIRESREFDHKASAEMKIKMEKQRLETPQRLRMKFTGMDMSDRVKKLFDLTLGSQREVVKAQMHKGMELFQLRTGDTGSSAVQVVALTTRIQNLQSHLTEHRKDNKTKRGLNRMYVRRRKLLDYLERTDFDSYRRVVKTLGLIR